MPRPAWRWSRRTSVACGRLSKTGGTGFLVPPGEPRHGEASADCWATTICGFISGGAAGRCQALRADSHRGPVRVSLPAAGSPTETTTCRIAENRGMSRISLAECKTTGGVWTRRIRAAGERTTRFARVVHVVSRNQGRIRLAVCRRASVSPHYALVCPDLCHPALATRRPMTPC